MPYPFLDTNIFLRHVTQDHVDHSPRSTAVFARIENGDLVVRTADTAIFETVFTLQTFYHYARPRIRDAVLPLIELPGVLLPRKSRWKVALDLYVHTRISLVDAYHAALMTDLGLDRVITFDRDFDKIPGIIRIEP